MSQATPLTVRLLMILAGLSMCTPLYAQNFVQVTPATIGTDLTDTWGASWVDYDGDGDQDLFLSNVFSNNITPNNVIYRNDGDGSFTRATAGALTNAWSAGNCWADYDNDDDLDVFTTGQRADGVGLYQNNGGTFTNVETSALGTTGLFWACSWADYDNDGFVDLVAVKPAQFGGVIQANYLYHNNGDGTFERITSTPITETPDPQALKHYTVPTWSDFDLDGDVDLFIGSGPVNNTAPDNLFRNLLMETGTATFEQMTQAPIATDQVDGQVWNWIDYDNDGDLDAYLTNYSGGNSGMRNNLYRNDEGTYTRVTTGALVTSADRSLASTWGDFDNDGDLDVFVTNKAPRNRYYVNNGDGTFTSVDGPFATNVSGSWPGPAADYDGDGDLDLFVGTPGNIESQPPSLNVLYRNDLDNDNHWLKIKAVGVQSNRAAIGAKVRATAVIGGQDVTQLREISSQNTFNGQHSLEVHVGLGDATVVEKLRIEWPSGTEDVLENVMADQTITVEEGSTPTSVAPVPSQSEAGFVEANYPNPFVRATTFRFHLAQPAYVTLRVYDVLGREVAVLVRGHRPAGTHTVRFDADGLPPGVYYGRLETPHAAWVRSIVHRPG